MSAIGTKPESWNWQRDRCAFPEFWRGDYINLPLFDLPALGNDLPASVFDHGSGESATVFDGDTPATVESARGGVASRSGSGKTSRIECRNVISGKSEFTAFAVVEVPTVGTDLTDSTIWGQWSPQILIVHTDSTSRIRFLVRAGGSTVGAWTDNGAVSADQLLAVAARLQPDGRMDVIVNGTPFNVRTGSSLTIDGSASDVICALDGPTTTNDPFHGWWYCGGMTDVALADDVLARWAQDPFAPWRQRDSVPVFAFGGAAAGGGDQSVSVTVATEADAAAAVTPTAGTATIAIGGASEADAAAAVTPTAGTVTVAVGGASEADAAAAVTPTAGTATVAVGGATETDTAASVNTTSGGTVAVGETTETDTASSVTPVAGAATVAVGGATETDSASAVSAISGTTVSVGAATETNSAASVTPTGGAATQTVGVASEADTASSVSATGGAQTVAVGGVSETDTASAVTVSNVFIVSVQPVTEMDTASSVSIVVGGVAVIVGGASETDSASSVAGIAPGTQVPGLATMVGNVSGATNTGIVRGASFN